MSLQDVRAEYVQERKVLQAWKTRMDISAPVTEVPPESAMSLEYKVGWKRYLDAVLAISNTMINQCDAAVASGNTAALEALLTKEAEAYDSLADTAEEMSGVDLSQLVIMLRHEAQSRRDTVDEL